MEIETTCQITGSSTECISTQTGFNPIEVFYFGIFLLMLGAFVGYFGISSIIRKKWKQ